MFSPGAFQSICVEQTQYTRIKGGRGKICEKPPAVFEIGRLSDPTNSSPQQSFHESPTAGKLLRLVQPDGICLVAFRNHVIRVVPFEGVRIGKMKRFPQHDLLIVPINCFGSLRGHLSLPTPAFITSKNMCHVPCACSMKGSATKVACTSDTESRVRTGLLNGGAGPISNGDFPAKIPIDHICVLTGCGD